MEFQCVVNFQARYFAPFKMHAALVVSGFLSRGLGGGHLVAKIFNKFSGNVQTQALMESGLY